MSGIPPLPTSITPQFPPITHSFPVRALNNLVGSYGVRLQWMQSSQCPCVYGGPTPGSPARLCQSCFGRGVIWQLPSNIFTGLITYKEFGSKPPGYNNDPQWGSIMNADPNLTIPSTSEAFDVWQNASVYDAYVEIDATARLYTSLTVGDVQVVPYQHSLSIAPTGAVSIWNTQTKTQEFVSGYTVNGPEVILSGYPQGTPYTVEFVASPVYVAYGKDGGMPHTRPFGNGIDYPRRFRLKLLDMWLRETTATSSL